MSMLFELITMLFKLGKVYSWLRFYLIKDFRYNIDFLINIF